MKKLLLFCFALHWSLVFSHEVNPDPLSDDFIDLINKEQSSWTAGRNFPKGTSLEHIKRLLGARRSNTPPPEVNNHDPELIANLPESFDSRDKWPNCHTLNDIRDQGACGSCWAFGSVEAITDRYCTCSNGTKQFYFSAEDVLSCSGCGDCNGGYPDCVYDYWKRKGIVSGGAYNSSQGCRPYEIPPCQLYEQGLPCTDFGPTPKCVKSCLKGYNISYEKDLRYASKWYAISGEDNLKAELFTNGPVTARFVVYHDFITYKSGVYKHKRGNIMDGHIVKLLGWGEERGVKYWLGANSWNVKWGEKGFFKILRGENHCGIEEHIRAGVPRFNNIY